MKKNRFIKIVLLTILILSTLTYCKKDEETIVGRLSISFYNHPSDIDVIVYSMENTEIPICSLKLNSIGEAEKELNIGNYYIKVYSGTFFSPIGFQINPDKTTKIHWGTDNGAIIQ